MIYSDFFLYILNYKPICQYRWVNYSLRSLMMLVMLSPLSLSITNYIIDRENIHIPFMIFYLFGPVHYMLGLLYSKTRHLEGVLIDCKHMNYSLKPVNRLILLTFIVATLGILTNVLILVFSGHPLEFSLLLGDSRPLNRLVYTWFFINWIFSSYAISVNTSIFSFVFYKHLQDLKELESDLTKQMIWKMDQTSFTEITRRIIGIKYVIKGSVTKLSSFFTSTTTIGAIGLGSVVQFKTLNPYLIYYIVLYFICLFVFFYFIYQISNTREEVLSIINSPSVMFKYLTNVKSMHNVEVLRRELNELKKIDPDRVCTLNKFKIAAYSPTTLDQIIDIDKLEEGSYYSQYSDNDIDAEILTLSYKNNAAIDWLILERVLKDKWTGFELFGISFDGIDVIKKGAGVVSGLVIASTFITSLNIL